MHFPAVGVVFTGAGVGWPKREVWALSRSCMVVRLAAPTSRACPSTACASAAAGVHRKATNLWNVVFSSGLVLPITAA
eukprot:1196113-Prorocentrum_minimum.AAC.15